MNHIYSARYINKNGCIICHGTTNSIPRIGEKVQFVPEISKTIFVVTDIIHRIKSNGQPHQDVDIYIKPA